MPHSTGPVALCDLGMRYGRQMGPDSKVHGANMGPTWVLSAPDGPHVGPMNLAAVPAVWSVGPNIYWGLLICTELWVSCSQLMVIWPISVIFNDHWQSVCTAPKWQPSYICKRTVWGSRMRVHRRTGCGNLIRVGIPVAYG